MNFLMRVYREHENLRVVYAAEMVLKGWAGRKCFDLPPFSFGEIEKWWEENKTKYRKE